MKANKPTWPPARVFVVTDESCEHLHEAVPCRNEALAVARSRRSVTPVGYKPCRFAVHEYRLVTKADKSAERAVGIGEVGGFGVDPKDSAALLELRAVIDDYLGWRNEKEEHAGDYVARVKQVAKMLAVLGLPARAGDKTKRKPAKRINAAKKATKRKGVRGG